MDPLPEHTPLGPEHPQRFYAQDKQVFEVKIHEPTHSTFLPPEAIIHHAWESLRFNSAHLVTTDNQVIKIVRTGTHNSDSGPDFLNAHLVIDGILWTGAIELHIYSKDWYKHKHHLDTRYNNTILHVTLFRDSKTGKLKREDGSTLPELVLHPLLHISLRSLIYYRINEQPPSFPCENHWKHVPNSIKRSWIQTLTNSRLTRKASETSRFYLQHPSLEAILHLYLFRALGYRKNSDPMAELARRIPLSISRELRSTEELEALHFGVAGLLPKSVNKNDLSIEAVRYIELLQDTFQALQKTYAIPVMSGNSWLFFRLRPANFPTIRIAQAVYWLSTGGLLNHDPVGQLYTILLNSDDPLRSMNSRLESSPSSFWNDHYHFNNSAAYQKRLIGKSRLRKLFINAIAPLFMFIADQNNEPALEEKILRILKDIPPEKDHITRMFTTPGFSLSNGMMSQGIHELYSNYCSVARCLNCKIGQYILNKDPQNNE